MSQKKIDFVVLRDDPVKQDAFSGGGHARTAGVLRHLIEEFDGKDRAIGLEGNWGAGKSSIIRMAASDLQEQATASKGSKKTASKDFQFFTFDLWRHQTSPFRRAFLENLTKWMMEQSQGDEEKRYKRILSGIQRKQRTIDTKRHGKYSWFGLISVLFLLALPVIYMWLSPFAFVKNGEFSASFLNFWPFLIIVAIIIFALIDAENTLITHNEDANDGDKIKYRDALARTIGIFSKDSSRETVTQDIRDVDPTDFEFTETFRKLLNLYQTGERRLVVVFDNIDRLPTAKISDAWSNIRAVFAGDENKDPDNGAAIDPRLTVTAIVPYDRLHIIGALSPSEKNVVIARPSVDESLSLFETAQSGSRYAQQDLFRKSFDAILNVAPPVLSDSSAYFESKMNEALVGGVDADTIHRTYQVFHEKMRSNGIVTTPRHIISFINQTVSLWAQWRDTIPMPTVAVYIVHRDEIDRDPSVLRNPTTISDNFRYVANDPKINGHLAALAFNVEPELAMQLLLTGEIERVLTTDWSDSTPDDDAEPQELVTLRESPGFDHMLSQVVSERAGDWVRHSATRQRNVVQNLSKLACSNAVTRSAKKRVLRAMIEIQPVNAQLWKAHIPLVKLYEFCESEIEIQALSQQLSNWLMNSPDVLKNTSGATHSQTLATFISAIKKSASSAQGEHAASTALRQINVPTGMDYLFGLAAYCRENGFELTELADFRVPDGFSDRLTKDVIEEPWFFNDEWPQVRHKTNDDIKTNLLNTLISHLQQTKLDETFEDYRIFLDNLYMLGNETWTAKNATVAKKAIEGLIANGTLCQVGLKVAPDNEDGHRVVAHVLWHHLQAYPSFDFPGVDLSGHAFGDLRQGRAKLQEQIHNGIGQPEVIEYLARMAIENRRIPTLIKAAAQKPKTSGLAQEIIVEATENHAIDPPSLSLVLPHYDFLKETVGNAIEKWLAVIGSMSIENWKNINLLDLSTALVRDIASRKEDGWKKVREMYDTQLKNHTSEEWAETLTANRRVKIIAEERIKDGLKLDPAAFQLPFTDHLALVLSGQYENDGNWDGLADALTDHLKRTVASDLLTRFRSAEIKGQHLVSFFEMYPRLISEFPFADHPDITVQRFIYPLMFIDELTSIKPVYEGLQTQLRKAYKNASETPRGALEDTLELHDKSDSEIKRENAEWWRKLLGIEKRKATAPKAKKTGGSD